MLKRLQVLGFCFLIIITIAGCGKDSSTNPKPEPSAKNPTAAFSKEILNGGVLPTNVKFTNNSTNANSYSWEFGDGESSGDESPTHAYAKSGDYDVTLTASSDNDSDSKTMTITVPEEMQPNTVASFDSVAAFSGNQRAMLRMYLPAMSDITVTEALVFWDDSTSTKTVSITGSDSAQVIIDGLDEKIYTFNVVALGAGGAAAGEVSTKKSTSIEVFGPLYESNISNRTVSTLSFQPENSTGIIEWDGGTASDVIKTQISYMDAMGSMADMTVAPGASITNLPNYKGSDVDIQTFFKPNATAIDTFSTSVATQSYTGIALLNSTFPIQPADQSDFDANNNRWSTPANWNVNQAAKVRGPNSPPLLDGNANGEWGGFDGIQFRNNPGTGGFFNISTGDTSFVHNGKVSKTLTLPAGTYTFKVTQDGSQHYAFNRLNGDDAAYVVVASGTALPDEADLGTALGSTAFFASNDNTLTGNQSQGLADQDPEVQFTLAAETEITLGFLAYYDDAASVFRVTGVSLTKQ